jgi:hypothetical protein
LAVAGIEHLVVKGVGLAAVMGGRPVDRGGGDIDLWVRPADVARAEVALAGAGWVRAAVAARIPLPSDERRWRWMLRVEHELVLGAAPRPGVGDAEATGGAVVSGVPVDLHWRLYEFEGEFSFGFEGALAGSVPVTEVGPTVRTLCAAHALEHVAQHGRKEAWLVLRQVMDVARLAVLCGPEVVGALAARSRNVRLAVAMAARVDERLVGWHGPLGPLDRRLVDEAWACCLGFGSYSWRLQQPGVSGRVMLGARVGYTWWVLRSAPGWRARGHHVGRLVGRLRVLFDRRDRFLRGTPGGASGGAREGVQLVVDDMDRRARRQPGGSSRRAR